MNINGQLPLPVLTFYKWSIIFNGFLQIFAIQPLFICPNSCGYTSASEKASLEFTTMHPLSLKKAAMSPGEPFMRYSSQTQHGHKR
jgi:hypothetical protein